MSEVPDRPNTLKSAKQNPISKRYADTPNHIYDSISLNISQIHAIMYQNQQ